jgi:tetratricopeptide (TPR) repeat protein
VQGEAGEWDDIDDALANLNRDIKLRPADAWGISSRGQIYLGLGRYDEALADLDRALELDPDGETFGSRGQVYRLLGREEEARADFARAIELDPGYKPTGD